MSALPPYWVRLELRKKLVVIGCAVGVTPMPGQARQELLRSPPANSSGGLAESSAEPRQAAGPGAGVVRRRVGERAGDVDRLVVVGRVVVVGAVDVAGDEHQRHALAVGVANGAARELGVGQPADRALGHARAVVGGVGDGQRVVVGGRNEGVPDPQRHELALGAQPGLAGRVVGLGQRLPGAPGAVAVGAAAARGVEGVVVVVEEVPAGDVVDVAVGVARRSPSEKVAIRSEASRIASAFDARVRGVVAGADRRRAGRRRSR